MMFVKTNPFYVVPRSCLVAKETLIDLCIRLSTNLLVDHFEVLHVMAWGSLMALGAVLGCGRGMAEFWNGPFRGRMTLCAVLTE